MVNSGDTIKKDYLDSQKIMIENNILIYHRQENVTSIPDFLAYNYLYIYALISIALKNWIVFVQL